MVVTTDTERGGRRQGRGRIVRQQVKNAASSALRARDAVARVGSEQADNQGHRGEETATMLSGNEARACRVDGGDTVMRE